MVAVLSSTLANGIGVIALTVAALFIFNSSAGSGTYAAYGGFEDEDSNEEEDDRPTVNRK